MKGRYTMKTIIDYIEYALQSTTAMCILFRGADCTDCKHEDFCRVNSALIAADIMLKAGEYH